MFRLTGCWVCCFQQPRMALHQQTLRNNGSKQVFGAIEDDVLLLAKDARTEQSSDSVDIGIQHFESALSSAQHRGNI